MTRVDCPLNGTVVRRSRAACQSARREIFSDATELQQLPGPVVARLRERGTPGPSAGQGHQKRKDFREWGWTNERVGPITWLLDEIGN